MQLMVAQFNIMLLELGEYTTGSQKRTVTVPRNSLTNLGITQKVLDFLST